MSRARRFLEEWYGVTFKNFVKHHGAYLWAQFGRSLLVLLKDYRPDYEWLEWHFAHVPLRFWQKWTNRRRYFDWLGRQLGFHSKAAIGINSPSSTWWIGTAPGAVRQFALCGRPRRLAAVPLVGVALSP